MPFTYMLRCADGNLYTGWTVDLDRRLRAHQAGKASRYTRARLPVTLVYSQEHATPQEARQQEAAIRRLRRREKLKLISNTTS
jgi:putative endonuclease